MPAGRSFAVAAFKPAQGFTARSRLSGLDGTMHRAPAPFSLLHRLAFMGLGITLAALSGALFP